MDLSIVIPCYGHSKELELCLRTLTAHRNPMQFEVIVVDSASDPSVLEVTQHFQDVSIVRSQTRLFPGKARNLGVRHATGFYLAFLDSDCIPSEHWIETVISGLQAGHVLIGGPVLDVRPAGAIAWVDNHMQFSDFQSGRPAGPGDHFPACNIAIRRQAFAESGGFGEDILTGEDVVFSEQALKLFPGGMWFEPQLIVYHHGRRALRGMLEHQQLLGRHRSRLGLLMTPAWHWLARSPWLGGLALLRRLGYIFLRTWQYDKKGMFRLILSLPLLLLGLTAWTYGFYQGVYSSAIGTQR